MKRLLPITPALATLLALVAAPVSAGSTIVYSSGGAVVSGSGAVFGDVVVGKGPIKNETRQVGVFSRLTLAAPVVMNYTVSPTISLKVAAPANILAVLTTEVKDGALVVDFKKSVSMTDMVRIEASGPSLARIEVSGSSEVTAQGLSGKATALEVTGSATVTLTGQVDSASFDISGSGAVDAARLRAREVAADVSGAGTLAVFASSSAKVDISGSGEVTIAGNPKHRLVERSGAGGVVFK